MSEIKDCPFCGGDAEIESCGDEAWIQCSICDSKGPCHFGKLDVIIDVWNTRASQSKVKAEGIREAVKQITVAHRTMDSLEIIDQVLDYASQLEKGE